MSKSDQESSIGAMVEEALVQLRRTVEHRPLVVVPEVSAVGESQSNGTAERAVQAFEDDLRTLKSAFEERIGERLGTAHPVLQWLVEHAASLRNRFHVGKSGLTPYEYLHGRKANGNIIEFGERVFYYVPTALKAKLNLRWKLGIFLGCVTESNESYVGAWNGDVIKARGLTRVVEGSRWSKDAVNRITGTPAKRNPSGNREYEAVEESLEPHAIPEDDQAARLDDPQVQEDVSKRVRITQADLTKYGYSEGCPRCNDLQAGHRKSGKGHSEACRIRMYGEYQANDDPKWRAVSRQLDKERAQPGEVAADVDLEGDLGADTPIAHAPEDERVDFDNFDHEPNDQEMNSAEVDAHQSGVPDEGEDNGFNAGDFDRQDFDDFPDIMGFDGDDDENMVDALVGAG